MERKIGRKEEIKGKRNVDKITVDILFLDIHDILAAYVHTFLLTVYKDPLCYCLLVVQTFVGGHRCQAKMGFDAKPT